MFSEVDMAAVAGAAEGTGEEGNKEEGGLQFAKPDLRLVVTRCRI